MNLDNPVIKLCAEGTRAEFEGRIEDARTLYMQAWEASKDDYEACVAAHYVARHQEALSGHASLEPGGVGPRRGGGRQPGSKFLSITLLEYGAFL